jgi:O-antigen/teichoic acid export membrane protein
MGDHLSTFPEPGQAPSIPDAGFVTKAGEGQAVERERETGRGLINSRLLAKNAMWNLLGGGIPTIAAVFAIPRLTRGMGTDRFGMLTLAWVLIGYFSLFDMGLSRALTKLVSEKLGAEEHDDVPGVFWTSLLLMTFLGFAGTIFVFLVSPWLIHRVLKVPISLQSESLHSFLLLGLSIPVVISTTALRGYLEAYQRFRAVNAIRTPMSVFNFIGPLFVLPYTNSLTVIVAVLVVGRVLSWLVHVVCCLRVSPVLRRIRLPDKAALRSLVRFGSWMTVSNIVGPLLMYSDRFLIGAVLSVTAVAYYATPYEVVNKLLMVPMAVAGVLFPAFSTAFNCDRNRMVDLFERGCKCVFLVLFPITLILTTFAHEILQLWLGNGFAENSTRVLQLLSIGFLMNSLSLMPFNLLQGISRPDLTAKLHILELALYLPFVWWATLKYGIAGTAAAALFRVALDSVVLFVWVDRAVRDLNRSIARIGALMLSGLPMLAFGMLSTSVLLKSIYVSVVLVAFLLSSWFLVLTPKERTGALRVLEQE